MARKILLADDSVTAQNMGRKILADAGYEVIAVNNGSAALKKIAELKPDLVILDVYMPGYSGLEVCQRLKESQETARIPVLLTVGKLEPFKPEEAQRVRAEGFIVKPFEASELLSTLSKLEDKVVPRSEPSKPGRFARAIAAAEESGRGSRNEPSGEDTGWKSRIGFPKQKTEPEEKDADEAPVYNAVNNDLRTVVETPLEKAAEKIFKTQTQAEETRQPAGQTAETSVDMAALAPAGLPKDVTPEEVAAIAAAAAQIQMAGAIRDEHQISEMTGSGRIEPSPAPQLDGQSGPATPVEVEAKAAGGKEESVARDVAAEIERRRVGDERSEAQDVPVTMAATAESVVAVGGSRWTAVSVALEGEEATVSLDQEMRKAYAALVAEEKNSAASAPVPEAVEAPIAAISNPVPELVPAPEVMNVAAESEPVPVAEPVTAGTSAFVAADFVAPEPARLPEPAVMVPAPMEVAAVEAPVAASLAGEFAQTNQEAARVVESVSPVVETKVADAAGLVEPVVHALPPATEAVMVEATASSSSPARIAYEVEPKEDSETVKSTAAAWANWHQTRDTGRSNEMADAQPKEFAASEPTPMETNARAVAAGAEQIFQEATAAATGDNPSNVASIVDSVLADLRPKLMEEISRKMSEKK